MNKFFPFATMKKGRLSNSVNKVWKTKKGEIKVRKISYDASKVEKEKSSVAFFATLFTGSAAIVVVSSGLIAGFLDRLEYKETPAQVVRVERDSGGKCVKVSYRYRFKHYLFEKTLTVNEWSLFGGEKQMDFSEGENIIVQASQKNPQLSCFSVPLFQPIGSAFFWDRRGKEVKQVLPHVEEMMRQRKQEGEKEKAKEKWKERARVVKEGRVKQVKSEGEGRVEEREKREKEGLYQRYFKGPFGKLLGIDYEMPEEENKK